MCFLVEGARWEEEEEKGRRRERNGVRPPLRHCAHRCPLPPPFPPSCREQRRMARERKCTFTMAEWCKEARTVWIWEGFFLDCVQKRFGIRGETLKDLTRKTFRQQRTFQLLFDISCPKENCCRENKNREKPNGEKIILYFIVISCGKVEVVCGPSSSLLSPLMGEGDIGPEEREEREEKGILRFESNWDGVGAKRLFFLSLCHMEGEGPDIGIFVRQFPPADMWGNEKKSSVFFGGESCLKA